MTSGTQNNRNVSSFYPLETAYEIVKYTHSIAQKDLNYNTLREYDTNRSNEIPNAVSDQTQQGLVLQERDGFPYMIYTPYGALHVCGGTGLHVNWETVMETLKKSCGLMQVKEKMIYSNGAVWGPSWAITEWKGQKIEKPIFRAQEEYISYEEVKKIWNEFIKTLSGCSFVK